MECRFQIFVNGQWVDCAGLVVHESGRTSLAYDVDYAFSQNACLSLNYPVQIDEAAQDGLPPFFYDLIPQGAGCKFLIDELKLADGPAADFPLACAGAFNPIGRIRIAEAVEYFARHLARYPQVRSDRGLPLDEIVEHSEEFKERMHIHGMLAGGTTGVQGGRPSFS